MAGNHEPAYVTGIRVTFDQQLAGTGSGLLVSARHVVTCLHVVTGAFSAMSFDRNLRAKLMRGSMDEPLPSALALDLDMATIEVVLGLGDRQRPGCRRRARLIGEDRHADLVILELDRPVMGIVPPPFFSGDYSEQNPIAFRMDDTTIRRSALPMLDRTACHYRDAKDGAPAMIQHDHTAMAGNSGGPIICEHDGTHQLLGIAVMGSLGLPTGVMTTAHRLGSFLEAHKIQMPVSSHPHGLPKNVARRPGVASHIDIALPDRDTLRFHSYTGPGGNTFFRSALPLSVQSARALEDKPPLIGGDKLPANASTADKAAELVGRLGRSAGFPMRLPRIGEIEELRHAFGPSAVPSHFGLPPLLGQFSHPGGPTTFTEWLEGPDGKPVAALVNQSDIRIVEPDEITTIIPELIHPRLGIQPILNLE